MKTIAKKIGKITEKGQITLPVMWRRRIRTNTILFKPKGDTIEISPLYAVKQKKETEYTVFDAIRDNKGKGLKASDLLNILKKIDK